MLWLPFALSAPVFWAISNLVDADLIEHRLRDPWTLVALTGIFGGVPAVVVAITGHWSWPGLCPTTVALAAGCCGLLVYYPYFRALQIAQPAAVLLMWNLAPVFVVFLAWLFLGEQLALIEYLAITLLVASATIAAYHASPGSRWSRAFPWMISASALLAIASVLEKAVYLHVNFAVGLGWSSLASLVTGVGLICIRRKTRVALQQVSSGGTWGIVIANQGLDVAAATALARATSLGPVSLVHAVGALQPIFVLFFGAAYNLRQVPHGCGRCVALPDILRGVAAVALAMLAFGLLGE